MIAVSPKTPNPQLEGLAAHRLKSNEKGSASASPSLQRTRLGSLAHVMLDESRGNLDQPGRFVDTAIPAMLKQLQQRGALTSGLAAKLCGGAQMFRTTSGNHEVGRWNVEKAIELLRSLRIPVVAQHVGGRVGRVISFDLCSSAIHVKIGRDVVAVI